MMVFPQVSLLSHKVDQETECSHVTQKSHSDIFVDIQTCSRKVAIYWRCPSKLPLLEVPKREMEETLLKAISSAL